MTGQTVKQKSVIEGPRWAGIPRYIKNLCHIMDLKLDMEVDKRWLCETVRYNVEGSLEKVNEFNSQLESDLTDYNKAAS